MDQMQQGDVIARRVARVPKGAQRVEPSARGYVVAEGEATGHAHVIAPRDGIAMYEHDGVLYLKVDASTEASQTHEEHGLVTYEPGTWAIGRVQEKDWTSSMVRKVMD